MTDIWNLNALCRCCHSDGLFKSLQIPYVYKNNVEVYSAMLQEAFGVIIMPPPLDESFMICDECITILRASLHFKKKVLECEKKFEEYCKNEQSLCPVSDVKIEINPYTSDVDDSDHFEPPHFEEDNEVNTDDKSELKLNNNKVTNEKEQNHCMEVKIDVSENKIDEKNVDIKFEDTKDKRVEIAVDPNDTKRKSTKKTVFKKGVKARKNPFVEQEAEDSIKHIDLTLIVPLKTETGDSYTCKICGGSYKHERNIRRHIILTHTNPKLYKCEYCSKEYQNIYQYKSHVKKHGEKNFKCLYCDKRYHLEKILLEHINTHTKEKVFTCHYCSKGFLYKQTLRRHIKLHLGTSKGHMCDICGNAFNDSTHLGIHIRTVHEKIRPYSCDVCFKSFAANKTLKVHYRKHTGETPYRCDLCPQQFISFSHLKKHKLEHGPNSAVEAKYTCKICSKQFNERGRYSAHLRKHVGEKPFVCLICNKDFSCKYTLKRHINEHYGIKAYGCEICLKRFTQKIQLIRHMSRLHNPDRVLAEKSKCEICKKSVYNLDKHINAHNTKPFACEHCDKQYSEKNALNRHVRNVHYGIRPHQCDLCNKKYTQITSLRNHRLKVHQVDLKIEDEDYFRYMLPNFTMTKNENM